MEAIFYISGAVAIISTLIALTRANTVHALLYLIVSLMAAGVVFYVMGAPFAAVLEVIVYAGAIMVLFIFVVMVLNLGQRGIETERLWQTKASWIGPGVLALVLAIEMIGMLAGSGNRDLSGVSVDPRQVGIALFGPYLLGVELASIVLLAGVVGAYHLGMRKAQKQQREAQNDARSFERSTASSGDLVHIGAGGPAGAP